MATCCIHFTFLFQPVGTPQGKALSQGTRKRWVLRAVDGVGCVGRWGREWGGGDWGHNLEHSGGGLSEELFIGLRSI